MMQGTALKVRQLARQHGVSVPRHGTDHAFDMSVALNRLEGVHGDEVLALIMLLARGGHLTSDQAGQFVIEYSAERSGK